MADYPNSTHTHTTLVDGSDYPKAADINLPVAEIIAIETELGTNPKSIDDTVAPGASPASVAAYLDMVANIVKTMAGAANWYSAAMNISPSLLFPVLGRLTLTSATPITTADVTGAGTLYFTPYKGNTIGLYYSGAWKNYTFSEVSLSLTLTSGSVYDVFAYYSGSAVTLERLVWTNPTTRATALTTQDGVLVKSGDATRRYLGTIVASGTNTTEDSTSKRYVWNYYNRVVRPMKAVDTTNSWAYTTAAYQETRAGSTYGTSRVGFVIGWSEDIIMASAMSVSSASSGAPVVSTGIGLDSATNAATINGVNILGPSAAYTTIAQYRNSIAVGSHYLAWLEYGGANVTFYGDNGGTQFQTGLVAEAWM